MSRPGSTFKDVATQFLSAVTGRGLYVLLQVVLARALGPHDYGLYALGWTVAGLLGTWAPAGMPQAVLRFGMAGRRSLYSLAMFVPAAAGSLLAAAMYLAADTIAVHVFQEPEAAAVIRAFAPAVPCLALFMVVTAALRASGALAASALVSGLLFAVYLAATLIAFAATPSPVAAAHMYNLSVVLVLALACFLLPHAPSAPAAAAPAVLRFGLVTMFIHSANVFNLWADRLVVGMLADAATLGVYHAAAQLAMVVIVLRSAVTVVFETSIARGGGGARDLSRDFYGAARILLHACGPGLAVLAVTAGFWIDLLFGASFRPAAGVLVVLVLGQLAVTFCGPSLTALYMTGLERLVMALTIAGCVANVVGNCLLIPPLGAVGAAIGATVANLGVALVCLVVLVRSRRLSFSFRQFQDIAVAIAACFVMTIAATSLVGELSLLTVIPVLLAAYGVYALIVHRLCTVEDEALNFVRHATRRYTRRQA